MKGNSRVLLLAMVMACMLFTGCARSPQVHFYLLTAAREAQADAPALAFRIGVLPVGIPKYLDRQQIVTKTGPNSLVFAEYHRWAEPLADNARSALVEDLAAQLPGASVVAFPGDISLACDYVIAVRVREFGAGPDGKAVLRASWGFRSAPKDTALFGGEFSSTAPVGDKTHATLVAALSRLLADMSREMAARVGKAQLPETGR